VLFVKNNHKGGEYFGDLIHGKIMKWGSPKERTGRREKERRENVERRRKKGRNQTVM
jgi:hypothetical protein